jgi:hypothetical protein
MNLDLSNYTWEFVESINIGLCEHAKAAVGRTSEGYTATKDLWDRRKLQCSLLEALELAHQCHRLAPFLNYNGNSFVTVIKSAIDSQVKTSPIKLSTLRSMAGHFIAGTITPEEKQALSLLLSPNSTTLKVGDAVQTLKGTVRGQITELLPDGNVMYKTTQGITLKSSPEALIKQPSSSKKGFGMKMF